MNETIKFKQPIPFYQIRKAIKKVLDEYLPTSDLDDFSKEIWKYNLEEFYRDSAFTTLSPDLKGFIRNRKYSLYRDYDCSDLGTKDFILIDCGLPGRILLCDDGLYHPQIARKFSKDDVFSGIQLSISESYDFSEEEGKEWFDRMKGIVTFIINVLEQNSKEVD